jgi:hypothetical protein
VSLLGLKGIQWGSEERKGNSNGYWHVKRMSMGINNVRFGVALAAEGRK